VASKSHGIEDLTQFAAEVIRRSGEEALSYYGKGKPNLKFDDELVTEAELHLTEFYQDQLHAQFPEHQMFEGKQENKDYTHEGKRYLWIYDALDGVANFQFIGISFLCLQQISHNFPQFPPTDILERTYHTKNGLIN
jgi:myo-inositol-1(or 4)-monophosphatase